MMWERFDSNMFVPDFLPLWVFMCNIWHKCERLYLYLICLFSGVPVAILNSEQYWQAMLKNYYMRPTDKLLLKFMANWGISSPKLQIWWKGKKKQIFHRVHHLNASDWQFQSQSALAFSKVVFQVYIIINSAVLQVCFRCVIWCEGFPKFRFSILTSLSVCML